jgi:hypothetical protein
MMEAIVGCVVGFLVGKLGQPDKCEPCAINNLGAVCRECRVSATEEGPGGFRLALALRTDLNDVPA